MGALTGTKVALTEFAGDMKLYIITFTPASASDTITFVAATHKFRTIYGAFAFLEAGYDAALAFIFATFSGLVVTVVTKSNDCVTAATDWTGASARMLLVVGSR